MATPPESTERRDAEAKSGETPRHDTAEVPVTVGTMRRAFRINEIFTFLVAAATAVAAVFGAYKLLLSEAEAAGTKGAAAVERRVATLEQQQTQTKDDVHELAKDIRELYRVLPRVRDSQRLERPPAEKDGGP